MDFGAAMFFTDYSMTPVELGQATKARAAAGTAGKPQIAEMLPDRPAQPVSANCRHLSNFP